jgi:adenylate kinase
VITEILKKRLTPDLSKGFILEGYPRSIDQAKQLENITKIDVVINLDVSDRVIVERLSARVQCKNCGSIYNERSLKPRVTGKCDKCGGELFKRADDQPTVILERLKIYKEISAPVIDYYRTRKLLKDIINNDPDVRPEVVTDRIMELI